MRWIIGGKTYRPESLQDISITDLRAIRQQTGRSMKEITASLESTAPADGTQAELDITEMDDDQLCALSVLFWHARRSAGENLTIEEAANFPLRTLTVELDPGDETEVPAAPNRVARRRATTKKTASRKPTSRELAG